MDFSSLRPQKERRTLRLSRWAQLTVTAALAACQTPGSQPAPGTGGALSLEGARQHMVEYAVRQAGVTDERVLDSILSTERHEFVPRAMRARAYDDAGVPIGGGQTISSPFMVALMTEALEPRPTDRVLEIGTGSGYQAAVLSPLVEEVYSVEIVESLGRRAEETLTKLGYNNVHTRVGDGYHGWEEYAPFDKIMVTCSPEEVPAALVEQLKEGGMIVIPVGERHQQVLCRMVKVRGALVATPLRPTLFVPMTGFAEERRRVLPDPGSPALVNGDFEEAPDSRGDLPGWYYQRRMESVDSGEAPGGGRFIQFENDVEGQHAHVMQGLAIDGREVSRIDFCATMAPTNSKRGARAESVPVAALTFYDGDRRALNTVVLGPALGTSDWREFARRGIKVPETAREAIVRVGLFGATGKVAFDNLSVRAVP